MHLEYYLSIPNQHFIIKHLQVLSELIITIFRYFYTKYRFL